MSGNAVSWEAQEYVQRKKNGIWYVALIFVGLALSALAVWLQMWSFIALVVVSVIALIVYSVRPPRMLKYKLDTTGLSENSKKYPFTDYKSFGLYQEGEVFAIIMTPRKRFSPRVTVYFPSESGEKIVDAFGAHLPMEPVKLDLLDRLVRWLRI